MSSSAGTILQPVQWSAARSRTCRVNSIVERVDDSASLVTLGAGGIDEQNLKDPIAAFVLGQKGLMYNLSFAGTKFTKLDRH